MTGLRERNLPLDPQERMAAESDARETQVVGGAGTGKTQVVVARVAHLIGQGHEPRTIACLTTGGKVDVLNRRLEEHYLVAGRTLEVFVGDPASLANFFLRRGGAAALGWPANYSLWPQRRCIDETLARVNQLGWSDEAKKEVRPALAWHWSNRALDENESRLRIPEVLWAEILRVYREVRGEQGALSPSDVLVLATQFMEKVRNGEVSIEDFPETAGRFRHLVVDQGEDVTREEDSFLLKLAAGCQSLLVTCDPNQSMSLYLPSELPLSMIRRYPDMRRVGLNLAHVAREGAAETLVRLSGGSAKLVDTRQRGVLPGGDKPVLLQVPGTLTDMYVRCISELRLLLGQGLQPGDFALLFRRGNPVRLLRTLLAGHDIPSRLLAEPEVSRPSDGRAVAALLTLLFNPRDVFALQAAAAPGYPNKARLLGRNQARELGRLLRAGEPEPWAEVRRYLEGMEEGDPDRRAVSHLLEAMERLGWEVADL